MNYGKLGWNQTNYQFYPKSKANQFRCSCSNRRKCTVYIETGTVSKRSCIIINGQFIEWIQKPVPCTCVNLNRSMAYGLGSGKILSKINRAHDDMSYGTSANHASIILTQTKQKAQSLTIEQSAKVDRRRVYLRLKQRQQEVDKTFLR